MSRSLARRRRPGHPTNEADLIWDEMGLELGRASALDPRFHEMFLRGFNRARLELEAGRKPSTRAEALAGFVRAAAKITAGK